MFTFMHTYTPESWEGVIKNGLFRKDDGIKIMHRPDIPEEYGFNQIGKQGGALYELLCQLDCPFYIDRLQGGIELPWWYEYDQKLVQQYKEKLGNKFWGFQIHEWASNIKTDCDSIIKLYEAVGKKNPSPEERKKIWTDFCAGEISKDLFPSYAWLTDLKMPMLLEAFTGDEWSKRKDPKNRKEFMEAVWDLYITRCKKMDGMLIPVDSAFMAPRIEVLNGAKLIMPEVGWQIPNMRVQMAYTRGMAKAYGIRWGIYYECWGGTKGYGLTIPFSLREGMDEWFEDQLHRGNGADRSPEERENGGSSRSLQERAWHYAYLSGATVMGEEYGVCNTFRDYHEFDLSLYGRIKREFLRFTERFPEVGQTFTPIAIVLPADLEMWEVVPSDKYLGYPIDEEVRYVPSIREGFDYLFGHDGKYGNQGKTIKNGQFPDVFDIIHADQKEAIANYEYLIDFSADPLFVETHQNVIEMEEIDLILDQLLPCRIKGDVHSLYNQTEEGWLVLIMNNDGIYCDNFAGDVRIPEARTRVEIITKTDKKISIAEGNYSHEMVMNEQGHSLILDAGEWVLLRIG